MPLSDAEKRWYDSLRNTGTITPASKFTTPAKPKVEKKSRFADALDFGKKLGSVAFSGVSATAAILPGVDEEDVRRLPGPLEFAVDNLLSPVGLASVALTPFTGGLSIAAKLGLGPALSRSNIITRGAVELAGRAGVDLLAAGVGTAAAKTINEVLPDDTNPYVRTAATMLAGLTAGGVTGSSISRSVRPSVATAGTSFDDALIRSGEFLPNMKALGDVADEVQSIGSIGRTPGLQQVIELVNPSQLVNSDIGRITVADSLQKGRIEEAVKLTIAGAFPDNFSAFRIDKGGKALVKGERVPWKQAFDTTMSEDTLKFKNYVNEATLKYNSAKPNNTIDGTWIPEFDNRGRLLKPKNPADKPLFDEAKQLELRKVPLNSPEAVLHIYGRAALKAELDEDYRALITPMLVDADKVLATTPEGAALWEKLSSAVKVNKDARTRYAQVARLTKASKAAVSSQARTYKQMLDEAEDHLSTLLYKVGPHRADLPKFGGEVGVQSSLFPGGEVSTPNVPIIPSVPNTTRQLETAAKAELARLKAVEKASRKTRKPGVLQNNKANVGFQQTIREHLTERVGVEKEIYELEDALDRINSVKELAKLHTEQGTDPMSYARHVLKTSSQDLRKAKGEWSNYRRHTIATEAPKSLWHPGTDEAVPVAKFKGGYLIDPDKNVLEKLEEWNSRFVRGGPSNGFLSGTQQLNDAARYFSASLDFSGAFINLLPVLFTDPAAWGKAVYANWKSVLFDPNFQSKYISRNYDSLLEMARNGVPIGDIELFSSSRRGGLAGKLLDAPGVNKTAGPIFNKVQSGYETGLLVGRHELWKALKSDPNYGGDLRRVAKSVRSFTGGLDTAALGVGPTQRAIESILLFSPKMFRSITAMGADALRPWRPEGAQAAHTIFRMMAAGTGLFGLANVAIGIMEGDSEEEVMKRLEDSMNPLNGRQFAAVQVGDDWYGIGGQVRAMTQMLARTISDEDDKAGKDNNPFYEFFSGRLGPAPRSGMAAIEAMTGGNADLLPYDLVENPLDWAKLSSTSFLPFYAQSMLEEGASWSNLIDVVGLQSKPRSSSDVLNSAAWQQFNRKWADLTDAEQEVLRQENKEVVEKAKEFGSKDERGYRDAVAANDETARNALVALNNANLSPDDFKARAEEVLRDRWISNQEARQNFNILFEGESADSPKRAVMDAYYKTFDDATIPGTDNQVDWNRWEVLQADVNRRIAKGEFGDPSRAQQFIDERRRFEVPDEVKWYQDAKEVIRNSGYWDQTDMAFEQYKSLVQRLAPDVDSARALDAAIQEALNVGDRTRAIQLNNLKSIIDKKGSQLREGLRARDAALRSALEATGAISKKI